MAENIKMVCRHPKFHGQALTKLVPRPVLGITNLAIFFKNHIYTCGNLLYRLSGFVFRL